ncbi:hypothetical protein T439DRAFT_324227 [Meredithblackwellia eburnea MCA 4105]
MSSATTSAFAEAIAASHNPYPVKPWGFFFGIIIASVLYGLHISQLYQFLTTPRPKVRTLKDVRQLLFVGWVFLLSTLEQTILFGAGSVYFVRGIQDVRLWGYFLWPLSIQDGLIPLMGLTAQLFYGHRVWALYGRKRWVGAIFVVLAPLNFLLGVAMATCSFFWARHPFDLDYTFRTAGISPAAIHIPVVWLVCSALLDAFVTGMLLFNLATTPTHFQASRTLVRKVMVLTLETVLVTHVVGAVMAILFFVKGTRTDAFWLLLSIITECYALSILFTINSRRTFRQSFEGQRVDLNDIPPSPNVATLRELRIHFPSPAVAKVKGERTGYSRRPSENDSIQEIPREIFGSPKAGSTSPLQSPGAFKDGFLD